MRRGYPVIDGDGHTFEPEHLYDEYLDSRFRSRVRTIEQRPMGLWIREVDGKLGGPTSVRDRYPAGGSDGKTAADVLAEAMSRSATEACFGEAFLNGWDGASVGKAQSAEGVDISVIYGPLYEMWLRDIDPELAAAMARAYNRWLAQYRVDSGGVIHGAAPLPIQDVDLAIKELEYAYNECGIRAFWTRPNPIGGRLVADPAYHPLYEAIESLDVPVGFHTFAGSDLPEAGSDRAVCGWVDGHVYLHPYEQQMAMVDMIVRGVFDRFPRLRVGFLEAGSSWIGWLLDRLEEHMEFARWNEISGLQHEPLHYFQNNCWLTTECSETLLPQAIETVGDQNILFASDYPHTDAMQYYPGYVDRFLDHPRVSDESKRRILWDNAQRYYKFDEASLPAGTYRVASA